MQEGASGSHGQKDKSKEREFTNGKNSHDKNFDKHESHANSD